MHPLLQRADRALRDSAGTLSTDDLARHSPDKWSAAEILEHLGHTFSRTTKGLQRLVDHGAPTTARATGTQRFGKLVVVYAGYFPPGVQSPDAVRPRGADPAGVLAATLAGLAAMNEGLDAAELRFGPRLPVMDHPVLGPLSVHEWRRFHWVHTRHHARQIRKRAR
jgi:hypothetical protein